MNIDPFSQRARFFELIRRHILESDEDLSDDAFVRTVINRYLHERGLPLIDPAE